MENQEYQSQAIAPVRQRKSSLVSWIVLLFGIALLAVAYLQKQNILDWYSLRNYTAPAEISEISKEITLTDDARRVFYVNKPVILDSSKFNNKCEDRGQEKTIVLGCYYSNQRGIYLFHVSDARLQGVEQVTAAHELLHAGYDRLSSKERQRINSLLQDYYTNGLTDQRVKDTIESYRKTVPSDLVNEMHSIFGTEVPNLPKELEKHYKKYFNNRQTVVAYTQSYQAEFTKRKEQVDAYDKQLVVLKQEITSQQTTLEQRNSELTNERSELNQLLEQGNTKEYNDRVPTFNRHVAEYNDAVAALKTLVTQHNEIVDTRNAIALEQEQLSKAIDSQLESL